MAPGTFLAPRATNYSVCSTPECVQIAQDILSYVDLNVDPCSDFYQYTCGAWEKNAIIEDSASSNGTLESVIEKSYIDMKSILEGTYEDIVNNLTSTEKEGFHTDDVQIDKELFNTIQTYYELCMDEHTLDSLGSTPVYSDISLIENKLFPVNGSTTLSSGRANSSFIQTMALLQSYGIPSLAVVYVYADDKNPEMNSLVLDQPILTLPSTEYYNIPSVIESMRNGLNDILFKTLGDYTNGSIEDEQFRAAESNKTGFKRWSKEKIQGAVDRYIDFESKLANFSLTATEKQDRVAWYNPYSLSQLQSGFPVIDWSSLFSMLIPEEGIKPGSNSTIIVRTPTYFKKLNDFLSSNVTLEQLQEYFIIQLTYTRVDSLDAVSRSAVNEMESKISSGAATLPKRYRTCVRDVSNTFPNFMSRYYSLKEFGGENERKTVDKFITSIHQEWLHKLDDLNWLDNQTRAKAVEKVNLLKHKAAYSVISPDVRNPTALKIYDEGLTVNRTSFYSSKTSASLFMMKKVFARAGQKFDKDEWLLPAQTVNAYHSYNTNEIVVPAGILQAPFFSFDYPEYLNYGGIGMVIAHEITHAFDSNGRSYDGHGKILDWWTNDTSAKFAEYSQCFINQYSNITIQAGNKTLNVNGQLTLAENIADNGGLNTAYLAYQTFQANKTAERLKGLEQLSPEALFFVNFGRFWCGKSRPQNAENLLLTDTHSPVNVRVNGAVQNSRDFAATFNCPVGSPMNPEKKCSIW